MGCSSSSEAPAAATPSAKTDPVPTERSSPELPKNAGLADGRDHVESTFEVDKSQGEAVESMPQAMPPAPTVNEETLPISPDHRVSAAKRVACTLVDEALLKAQGFLQEGDALGAERVLAAAVSDLQAIRGLTQELQQEFRRRFRESEAFLETQKLISLYEEGVSSCLSEAGAGGEWQLLCQCDLDFKKLGLAMSQEAAEMLSPEYRKADVFYRRSPGKVEIRLGLCVPSRSPDSPNSLLSGWVAVHHETGHYSSWNPIIYGKGPVELQPRRKYLNLWHNLTKTMWFKTSRLLEERMFFNHEAGTHLLQIVDLPSDDERWTRHPAPKGFPQDPSKFTLNAVVVPQKHTTFMSIYFDALVPPEWPEFVLKFLLSWVCPEIVKRIIRVMVTQAIGRGGPHFGLIQADTEGIYAESESLVDKSQTSTMDIAGSFFSSKCPATVARVTSRTSSLTGVEATARHAESAGRHWPTCVEGEIASI